jgi:acetyltransferase-like isoleucine patch superfamily enzyme
MGGVRISCTKEINIGEEGLLGSVTIIDSDIIPHAGITFDDEWKRKYTASINIGNFFWAGTNSFVLKGCAVGDECVLGAGSIIWDATFPDKSLLMGNPARRIGSTRQ